MRVARLLITHHFSLITVGVLGGALFGTSEFAELFMQRIAVDAQASGGFDLQVIADLHYLLDQFSFHAADQPIVKPAFILGKAVNADTDQMLNERLEIPAFHATEA